MINSLSLYTNFFRRYYFLLLIVFPAIFITGYLAGQAAILVTLGFVLVLRFRNRIDELILLLLLILIFGDSRQDTLQFFKPLRIILTVLISVFQIIDITRGNVKLYRNIFSIIPVMIIAFLSLTNTPVFNAAFPRTISYFLIPFMIFHYYKEEIIQTKGAFARDTLILLNLILLLGVLLIFIYPSQAIFGSGIELRFQGVFGNPNGVATFSLFTIPLAVYLFRLKLISKRFFYQHLLLAAVCIIASGSRTSLGSMILFLSTYFFYNQSIRIRLALLLFAFPFAMFLIFSSSTIGIVLESDFLSQRLRVESLATAGGRLESWKIGYSSISEAPFFGRGFTFDQYLYIEKVSAHRRKYNRALNAAFSGVLSLFLTLGIVGFIAVVYFIADQFRRFLDKTIILPFTIIVLLTSIFESWITSSLNAYTVFFYINIVVFQTMTLYQNHNKILSNKFKIPHP